MPSAFPGANIVCVCGQRFEVPRARASGAHASYEGMRHSSGSRASHVPASAQGEGPYRSAAVATGPEPSAMCPFCGNECPAMVRICPHCDVRLENVRCQRCFSLQPPGTFACARCNQALELEPLLDATDAPCPRCNHPLEVSAGDDSRVHECPRCGGIFVARDALADILCSAELGGALREGPPKYVRESGVPALDTVRYVPCPLCHTSMNRVNFGKVSGVIVDVCKMHGTWFDAGELTRVVAFAASGGLEKTRAREKTEQREVKERAIDVHLKVALMSANHEEQTRLELWRDLLRGFFFW